MNDLRRTGLTGTEGESPSPLRTTSVKWLRDQGIKPFFSFFLSYFYLSSTLTLTFPDITTLYEFYFLIYSPLFRNDPVSDLLCRMKILLLVCFPRGKKREGGAKCAKFRRCKVILNARVLRPNSWLPQTPPLLPLSVFQVFLAPSSPHPPEEEEEDPLISLL